MSIAGSNSVTILAGNGMLTGSSTLSPNGEPDRHRQQRRPEQPVLPAGRSERPASLRPRVR